MSNEKSIVPTASIEDAIGESGRVKRFRPDSSGDAPVPTAGGEERKMSADTAPATPIADTDHTRRTVKQRKGDLDKYRRRYMQTPRIEDRKPVFVSCTTHDRLDRIVRLLGERGMSVSGLIENIALRHLADHESDIEYWRRM
jgi:hypothetical protein